MRIRSCFILTLLLGCGHALSAAVLYTVTDLGTLGGLSSHAYGVDNLGQVVGESDTRNGGSSAFLYSRGQMADLGTLGGESSRANGINDAGQVTGSFTLSDGSSHAFLYSNGQVTDLGTLGGSFSSGNGINNAGQVTGTSSTFTGVRRAFLYSNGQITDLGSFGYDSFGAAINDAGQVTGQSSNSFFTQGHAFLYSNGQLIDLGTLSQGSDFSRNDFSAGTSINRAGQITGVSSSQTDGAHAFLYSGGQIAQLGDPRAASEGFAINDLGQVTGQTLFPVSHAFLYSSGQMMDLNDLISPTLEITLMDARGINERSQIVANGVDRSGDNHAFLLTPVPEPGTLALFAVAALGLWVGLSPHRTVLR